jgi:hypothetical protein
MSDKQMLAVAYVALVLNIFMLFFVVAVEWYLTLPGWTSATLFNLALVAVLSKK